MIKKYCDRCNKDMGIVYSMPFAYGYGPGEDRERPLMENETLTITLGSIADAKIKMRMVDLCEKCYVAVKDFIFNPEPVTKMENNNILKETKEND